MSPEAISVPKRPVAMFGLALLIGTFLSLATAVNSTPLTLLWLPTSIVLVGLLMRGLTVLLPAAIGMAVTMWLLDAPVWHASMSVLSVIIAPSAAYYLIQRLRANRRAVSHLMQTIHIVAAIALVQAPISAAIMFVGCYFHPQSMLGPISLIASHWVIETTSGIIFVRGMMVWMPNDGSGFCPVAGIARGNRRLDPELLVPLGLIVTLCLSAVAAFWTEQGNLARLFSIPLFVIAATSSLISNRRIASAVLMLSTFAIATISSYAAKMGSDPAALTRLAEVALLLLTGSLLLQLLNALVEERLAQQRRLRRKAFANEVTDLPNLRALHAYLASASLIHRVKVDGLLMAEVSVAGLMRWADISGRVSIMKVEREIGARLKQSFGKRMRYLIHVGTGRFILVLSRRQSTEELTDVMKVCFQDHQFDIAGNRVRLHCSIGVVDVPPGNHDLETALASLSIAQQKASKNGDLYFRLTLDDEQVRAYREDLAWVEKMGHFLATNRIRLFAQPIAPVQMSSESALNFEVLARMINDDGSILTPDKFLPAISLAGLQIEFDRTVISQTLQYLKDHEELALATHLCAINVTGLTICDLHFPEFLTRNLNERNIDASKITIEVTESDAIIDFESALANILTLTRAGISIAVDDFGTGQATFDYIRRMRPNVLKIDGSFVRRYAADPLDREIVESIVRLAKVLGAKTVAEFIETEQMADDMRKIGVDYLQGWAIAKPMPIEDIKSFCDARRAEMRKDEQLRLSSNQGALLSKNE